LSGVLTLAGAPLLISIPEPAKLSTTASTSYFGCCTNLIDFYRRIGVEKNIRWYETMTFVEPGGRISVLEPSFLPAPLHTAPWHLSFAPFWRHRDKLAIARAMAALIPVPARDTGESFLDWLHRHKQTSNAIERFWKPVLVSALSEDLELVSVRICRLRWCGSR
jgi:protoporphyrinogen oxidase